MQQNKQEIIFNSSDEALQMLAEITGKKVMIPDKAEPTVASDNTEEDADEDAEIAEGSDLNSVSENLINQGNAYVELGKQVGDAAEKVKDVTSI